MSVVPNAAWVVDRSGVAAVDWSTSAVTDKDQVVGNTSVDRTTSMVDVSIAVDAIVDVGDGVRLRRTRLVVLVGGVLEMAMVVAAVVGMAGGESAAVVTKSVLRSSGIDVDSTVVVGGGTLVDVNNVDGTAAVITAVDNADEGADVVAPE